MRWARRACSVTTLALTIAAFAKVAHADATSELASARAALDGIDYLAAKAALDRALAAGGSDPDQLVEIYQLRGTVAGALDETSAAQDAFAHALALRPSLALPKGTSPKATVPFTAAKKQLAGRHLEIEEQPTNQPPALALVVSDPLAMVATARVTTVVDSRAQPPRQLPGRDRIAVDLPPGHHFDVRVEALDEHGNVLLRLPPVAIEAPVATTAITAPPPARVTAEPVQPLYLRWWPYAGAAGASVIVGTAFGLAARSSADELQRIVNNSTHYTLSEAQTVASRANRDAEVSNVGFAVAGAFAIVSGIMFSRSWLESPSRRVVATPMPGGGGLAFQQEL